MRKLRKSLLAMAAVWATGLGLACSDSFFYPAAAPAPATVTLRWAGALAGPPEAFDQADNLRVRLFPAGSQSPTVDETLPFEPGPGQTRVTLAVELEEEAATFRLDLELRRGTAALFRGETQVALRAGETQPVAVPLQPVPAGLVLPVPYPTLTAYGDEQQLGGVAVFATGDSIPELIPTWSTQDPGILGVSLGTDDRWIAVARADGTARLTAVLGSLTETATILVRAEAVEVVVTPEAPTVEIGSEVQLTATAVDRRGNVIPRTPSWSSGSPQVATVDATGRVRGESEGKATIEARMDDAGGAAEVTVVPLLPTATTQTATEVSARSALLRGSVNPRGLTTVARFEYDTDPSLSKPILTATEAVGSGQTAVPVSAQVTNLLPATTYYHRIVATADAGVVLGAILSFTTPAVPTAPSVPTLTVDGGVYVRWNDNSSNESRFEVERAVEPAAVSGPAVPDEADFVLLGVVGANVKEFYDANPPTGLLTYRVRACAPEGCSDYSPTASLQYAAPPLVGTSTAANVGTTSATLQGSVDPRGSATTAWFELDDEPGLASPIVTQMIDVGSAPGVQALAQPVSGLAENTTYYFRAVAENAGGTAVGIAQSFTTERTPAAPSSMSLSLGSVGVDVRWKDNSDNEAYFEIQREFLSLGAPQGAGAEPEAIYIDVGTAPANATFFNDASPPNPAVLRYRVRACSEVACSPYSPPDTIYYGGTEQAARPAAEGRPGTVSAPRQLDRTSGSTHSADVELDGNRNPDRYGILTVPGRRELHAFHDANGGLVEVLGSARLADPRLLDLSRPVDVDPNVDGTPEPRISKL